MERPLDFLKLPVKNNGDAYIELMDRKNGDQSYLAFIILLVAWGSQNRSRRKGGIIWSWQEGRPATLDEIGRKMHFSPKKIEVALPYLIDIGWIVTKEVEINGLPQERPAVEVKPVKLKPPDIIPAGVQELYDYWHSDDLVWHDKAKRIRCRCPQSDQPWMVSQSLTPDIIDNINQHLGRWTVDQLKTSVDNYHSVLTSAEHGKWSHRWSLSQFFGRHQVKNPKLFAFYRFTDGNFKPDDWKGAYHD